MSVRGKGVHWKLREIIPRHWDSVAAMAGLGPSAPYLESMAKRTPIVVERLAAGLPAKFPERVSGRIFEGLSVQANRLMRG